MADDSIKMKIIEAAGPIFAERGFDGATVRDICGVAKVNVASIKYYFGDKQSLYLEVVKFARQVRAERYPFDNWNSETSPHEKLYDFVSSLLRRLTALQDAPWQINLLMSELMRPTEPCRVLVQEYFAPMFRAMLRVIDQLVDRPLSEDERLKIGFSIVGQCLHYRYSTEVVNLIVPDELMPQFGIEQLADHITRFCLQGLGAYSDQSVEPNIRSKTPTEVRGSEDKSASDEDRS